jgi:hypothetical protein
MLGAMNGHLECVKFIIANPLGIDATRTKGSCVNLQTIKGLTALHIFCQEALPWADDILFYLLLGKADTLLHDQDGKSPLDYARDTGRVGFVALMEQWPHVLAGRNDEAAGDAVLRRKMRDAEDELERLYAYHYDPLVVVGEFKANFPTPDYLFEEQRVGSLPKGMKIHEHHIGRLTSTGFDTDDLVDALHTLDFSKGQAEVNVKRREDLVKLQDSNWQVPAKPDMLAKRTKNRRKKGDVNIQETKEEKAKREADEKAVKDAARAEREAKLKAENEEREKEAAAERIRKLEKAKRDEKRKKTT